MPGETDSTVEKFPEALRQSGIWSGINDLAEKISIVATGPVVVTGLLVLVLATSV
jgi:hypothetical protein